ncbi:PaaI family thioesterase [Zhaonella formicivorans]|uniref:PaaI family thioesterase n=1 Tax=Zhaonella formicivorans TaxID=2528593 RepID=UPI001D1244FB|nr:hotdog fold thioesterase [Zhaonella formicivorans]
MKEFKAEAGNVAECQCESYGEADKVKARMEKDALAKHLGIRLLEMKPGYARAVMEVKPELLNGAGITHGGALFSLADFAFAAASNAHGPLALALNVNINFLKATTVGTILTATACEENLTKKTGLYRMEVLDDKGELVALAQGTVYRKTT